MSRAPAFWQHPRQSPGMLSAALLPLSAVWALETRRRLASGSWQRVEVPVICVGNLTAGGTGKTPVVIALLERLTARGIAAHALSRGHGGRLAGPVRVDPLTHSSADTGDEPLLLSAFAPAWIARDRVAGAKAAVADGAQAIVMDDGLQNPGLAKTLSVVVVDAETGFGNGRVIPAGPLREPLRSGLARTDVLVTLGPDSAQDSLAARWPEIAGLPRLRAALRPLEMGMPWAGLRVLAFAGIGRPEKFFASLRAEGAEVAATRSFGDHEPYSDMALQRLAREAKQMGAQLVTTEKDAVRLPPHARREVLTFPVRLHWQDAPALDAILDTVLPTPVSAE